MAEESEDGPGTEEGAVLSPEELDISDEDNVVELEEGRYVISPGSREPKVPSASERSRSRSDPPEAQSGATEQQRDIGGELTEMDAHAWIEARLGGSDSKYAFDVTASFEDHTSQKALFSNDVVTTFENLIVWYASHAGGDTPVEDVLGILLVESNLSIRFPVEALIRYAESQGFDGSDTLEDLFAAARESGGVRFQAGGD